MFTKVLLATDLSAASDRVVDALGGLAGLGTTQVLLVNCLSPRVTGNVLLEMTDVAQRGLARQAERLANMGFHVEPEVVVGLPQTEVNRLATERDCDLVVVGSHGEDGGMGLLLGGVAGAIVYSMTRPTLVVRLRFSLVDGDQHVCDLIHCDFLGHILMPHDFSPNADRAFSYVQQLADLGARAVTLLHVQDTGAVERHLLRGRELREADQADAARLAPLREDLLQRGVAEVTISVRHGSPRQAISEATEENVSLVVMGSQGRGRVGEFFLGSVSYETVRRSSAPVLLIPLA